MFINSLSSYLFIVLLPSLCWHCNIPRFKNRNSPHPEDSFCIIWPLQRIRTSCGGQRWSHWIRFGGPPSSRPMCCRQYIFQFLVGKFRVPRWLGHHNHDPRKSTFMHGKAPTCSHGICHSIYLQWRWHSRQIFFFHHAFAPNSRRPH